MRLLAIVLASVAVAACGSGSTSTEGAATSSEGITTPNLVGMSIGSAKELLDAAGFETKTTYDDSDLWEAGVVAEQEPRDGAAIELGDTIQLTVSNREPGETDARDDAGPSDDAAVAEPGEVSRSTFDGTWPLTVSSGRLACSGSAVTFSAQGRTYAVNGTARTVHPDMPEIDAIWKDSGDGLKVNIGDLIDAGLALCG